VNGAPQSPTEYTTFASPIGDLLLVGESGRLRGLHYPGRHRIGPGWVETADPFGDAIEQLGEYFAGERRDFDLELDPHGTDFERAVWAQLLEIPYGETASYGAVARAIGRPDRARAVGAANGRNPLPIVIPCHRVIGADGSLVGYGGGLDLKRRLLELESGAVQQTLGGMTAGAA
jgi:methylated-DNA-[protein]-cysteine S-methyltransferase